MCRICRNDPRFFAQVSFVSVVCRSSDWSIHVQRISPRTNALLQPSLGAMTAPPMTDFHRAQISFARKQCFRNTAIFRILPASVQSQIHGLRGAADSFHVRDSHPIPFHCRTLSAANLRLFLLSWIFIVAWNAKNFYRWPNISALRNSLNEHP